MKLQNNFTGGKLNTDLDERILPKGQYPFMLNGRVVSAGSSNMGAVENHLGNKKLTDLNLTNAKVIGAYAYDAGGKIYFMVTSATKDLVVEYSTITQATVILLESSRPNGVLNFSTNSLITGINLIINGDSSKNLLAWTDDRNPPRLINIQRAKTYEVNGFTQDDISVIKKPPIDSIQLQYTYTPTTLENNISEKFLCFSYRFRYIDGEYSALAPFIYYGFSPKEFKFNFNTGEDEGMVNNFNALKLSFGSGDRNVTDVQLVFKESNSNNVYVIETFNKDAKGWNDLENQSFIFSNNKSYTVLPEKELYRNYDNVPKLAKAQELVGNRLCYGNYTEGYNMLDKFGEPIDMDFTVSQKNENIQGIDMSYVFTSGASVVSLSINTTDFPLRKNNRIVFNLELTSANNGSYSDSLTYIFNRNYDNASQLASDPDFISFVNDVMTNSFRAKYTISPPQGDEVQAVGSFSISGSTTTLIEILAPTVTLNSGTVQFIYNDLSSFKYKTNAVDSSLKTNRSYEFGIIYGDNYNRASPVLTSPTNSLYIPQKFSTFKNKAVVTINHKAPVWADHYRFAFKENKKGYYTLYANQFYREGIYLWVKLEGDNINKVKVGDYLIPKADLSGVIEEINKIEVLEIVIKEQDFIEGNTSTDTAIEVIEPSGTYMKIRPEGLDVTSTETYSRIFAGFGFFPSTPQRVYTDPEFGTRDTNNAFTPYTVKAGTQISVSIIIKSGGIGTLNLNNKFDKTYIAQAEYASLQAWYNAEAVLDITSYANTSSGNNTNTLSEFAFNEDGSKYYIKPGRNGTAINPISAYVQFSVLSTGGVICFETDPEDNDVPLFYEDPETFYIENGNHLSNTLNQDIMTGQPAIVELGMFNCYVRGNGVESYRIKDAFNAKSLNVDYRPSSTIEGKFQEVRRYADLTYSAVYNENTNINGLNEFNLYTANYKEDIDKKYGFIQKLYSRDTNLVVFQEDKVSQVLFGKDALAKADGTSDIVSIEDVLGRQLMYAGEWGISRNPESFAYKGNAVYFFDRKRGTPLRMSLDGITEINSGMSNYFRDYFKRDASVYTIIGGFDPDLEQYVLTIDSTLRVLTTINIGTFSPYINPSFQLAAPLVADHGIKKGEVRFDYVTSGKPVIIDVLYNGNKVISTVAGDSIYDTQLRELGLPTVSAPVQGTLSFMKDKVIPRESEIMLYAPLEDSYISFTPQEIVNPEVSIFKIVTNQDNVSGLQDNVRIKWADSEYASPYHTDNVLLGDAGISLFQTIRGQQGSGFIPSKDSSLSMEAFTLKDNPVIFNGTMRYLLSDTLYSADDIADIQKDATNLPYDTTVMLNGDTVKKGVIQIPSDFNKKYVYLIWNY